MKNILPIYIMRVYVRKNLRVSKKYINFAPIFRSFGCCLIVVILKKRTKS